ALNLAMTSHALRVIAVAYKNLSTFNEGLQKGVLERDLTFVGLIGMIDPPREEVKEAVKICRQAGIKPVMITGDHILTAKTIAKELGILTSQTEAITGEELSRMSAERLNDTISRFSVFARVSPEHKVRIVKAYQNKGEVVAMTGDGVNDAPALKAADIGCAMGITGTDVTKNAADMILTDDNFATIISAVKEGRGIYNNIKKDVHFLLSSNIGEVVTIFTASIINAFGYKSLGVPLMPVHLLWVNLVTDTLPAFALGMEPADKDIMKEKPRPKDESFFAHGLGWTIVWQGIMVGALTLIAYIYGNNINHEIGMTMAFLTLSSSQLFHAFNIKSTKSIFHKTIFNNKYLWGALIIGLILQFMVVYIPGLNDLFSLVPLETNTLSVSIGLALCPIVIVEFVKFVKNLFKKD
ncbi:MAG: cation-translocating P-type ATPase, partial [Erysipelotrichaceae bacterium]|nr:cation-translocating P-type ATPase [Erysipelotrichaceae bacterium]